MRILHVVECDGAGGVPALLGTYCHAQLDAGHEVHVLAPRDRIPGVTWHPWRIDRRRPVSLARAGHELSQAVRGCRPDVVHLHSFFAGLVGRVALSGRGRGPGPAVVYQPHSWAYDAAPGRGSRLAVTALERVLDRRTSHVLCNCEAELEEGRRHGVTSPGSAVGVPVDTRAFCPLGREERSTLRARLVGGERKVVLCVGRISRQKAQDRLVAAWLEDPIPGAELVLAGGGDVGPLTRLAGAEWGRSIRWIGHQDDVRPWLRAADVLVMPSRYEGQSVAVSEALACGLPVVACAVNGAEDAVVRAPHPAAGAVVGADDMSALMVECRRRVTDDRLRQREATAARLRATALFDSAVIGTRVERVYATAASGRAGGGPEWRGPTRRSAPVIPTPRESRPAPASRSRRPAGRGGE